MLYLYESLHLMGIKQITSEHWTHIAWDKLTSSRGAILKANWIILHPQKNQENSLRFSPLFMGGEMAMAVLYSICWLSGKIPIFVWPLQVVRSYPLRPGKKESVIGGKKTAHTKLNTHGTKQIWYRKLQTSRITWKTIENSRNIASLNIESSWCGHSIFNNHPLKKGWSLEVKNQLVPWNCWWYISP